MNLANTIILDLAAIIIAAALFLALINLFRFKLIPAKLIVLEMITNLLLSGVCIYAVFVKQFMFIDICLPLSLIMFTNTVVYCQYIRSRKKNLC